MNVSIFPRTLKLPSRNKLENITLRGFGGGWNAIETDLQMESTYLVTVRNFRRTPGGTQKIRYGSSWFADLIGIGPGGARIVDMIYFSARLVCVLSSGWIATVDGNGAVATIWNPTICAALPGAPAFWSSGLDSISFVPYKNELIIHNGINKPITVSRTFVVTFLQDLATGSNVRVPIGKYGAVVSNYHCVAGVSIDPGSGLPVPNTTIYITSTGTAGTFVGAPAPNDGISIDVGAFAPQGAVEIRGIAGFRANLLVFFQDQTVIAKLGQFNAAGVHEPFFPDTMPSFGILGHRCVAPVENDLLFSGLGGMASARRNLLSVSGTLESQSLSDRIEPEYRNTVGNLTDNEQLKGCWMVYDALAHDMLLFTPGGRVFVYSFNTKLKYSAWSEFSDLNVQCGCKSFLGRVFYADTLRVFQHGNAVYAGEEFFQDRELNRDANWANNTAYVVGQLIRDSTNSLIYTCILNHTSSGSPATMTTDRNLAPARWELYVGNDIPFAMELPWLDSKDPMRVKFLRFISMATKGDAKFTVKAHVDNLYKNVDGVIIFPPALSMEFIGNEAIGFGFDAGPYGGGRRSDDPRLYKFPVKFKKLKILIDGTKAGNLEVVNMSFLFSRGRYKR